MRECMGLSFSIFSQRMFDAKKYITFMFLQRLLHTHGDLGHRFSFYTTTAKQTTLCALVHNAKMASKEQGPFVLF